MGRDMSLFSSTRRQFLVGAAVAPLHAASSDEKPVRIVSVQSRGLQPQVAVSEGVLHMIYFAGDPKHGDVFYTRSKDFGEAFSLPVRVNSQEGSAIAMGAIRGAQLSIGKRNRVHVAW